MHHGEKLTNFSLGLESELGVRVLICPSKPSSKTVKVSHGIANYTVIIHHPAAIDLSSPNCTILVIIF